MDGKRLELANGTAVEIVVEAIEDCAWVVIGITCFLKGGSAYHGQSDTIKLSPEIAAFILAGAQTSADSGEG